jgi:hypothetical protein
MVFFQVWESVEYECVFVRGEREWYFAAPAVLCVYVMSVAKHQERVLHGALVNVAPCCGCLEVGIAVAAGILTKHSSDVAPNETRVLAQIGLIEETFNPVIKLLEEGGTAVAAVQILYKQLKKMASSHF